MMMDDERYKKLYNEIRKTCLCRGGNYNATSYCGIQTPDATLNMVLRPCVPDAHKTCPLFTFIKAMPTVFK